MIAGIPCRQIPSGNVACDHLEEGVFPAETLGKSYIVAPVPNPTGTSASQLVKFVGNHDGTTLTYAPSAPAGCPLSLNAGQVLSCSGLVSRAFEVTGDHEFAVVTFMPGASILDPADERGDPSMSSVVATEQFRKNYVFLAPDDYDISYAIVVGPPDAVVTVDGKPMTSGFSAITPTAGLARVKLGPGVGGAHHLESNVPVGIQVIGYGAYTSYQYPGGLDLRRIAEPPTR